LIRAGIVQLQCHALAKHEQLREACHEKTKAWLRYYGARLPIYLQTLTGDAVDTSLSFEKSQTPDFILALRGRWFDLACLIVEQLEDHRSPGDAALFLKEFDAIAQSLETVTVQVRRRTMRAA